MKKFSLKPFLYMNVYILQFYCSINSSAKLNFYIIDVDMQRIFQQIGKKMQQASKQFKQNYKQGVLIPNTYMDRLYDLFCYRIEQKHNLAMKQFQTIYKVTDDPEKYFNFVGDRIAQKMESAFEDLTSKMQSIDSTSGYQLAPRLSGQVPQSAYPQAPKTQEQYQVQTYQIGHNNYIETQIMNPNQFSAYAQNYNQNYNQLQIEANIGNAFGQVMMGGPGSMEAALFGPDMGAMMHQNNNNSPGWNLNQNAHNTMLNAHQQIIKQSLQSDHPHYHNENIKYNNHIEIQQDNPQNIYRKQYKTRDQEVHNIKKLKTKNNQKQKFMNGNQIAEDNKFATYKKELEYLQQSNTLSNQSPGLNAPHTQPHRQKYDAYNPTSVSVNTADKINFAISSELIRKGSQKKIYKISKQSIRKHSLKKQREAQSQMVANIQFLRSIRGTSTIGSPKNQWKQQTKHIKDTIQSLRQAKRKNIQSLGFNDSTVRKLMNSKIGVSGELMSGQISNLQRSDLLPEIKKSRRKAAVVHKPAPFSVYTLQKNHQIYYNRLS